MSDATAIDRTSGARGSSAPTGSRHDYAILPGGLSSADHERIHDLAAKGWKAKRIARAIHKHSSTVQWFMYRSGLSVVQYRGRSPMMRGGRPVKPFDAQEDAFITELRIEGLKLSEIAARTTERFGHPRRTSTVRCRLIMLAAREDA